MGFSSAPTLTVLFLVPFLSLVYAFQMPSNSTFSEWSRLLGSKLHDLVSTATQMDFVKNVYASDADIEIEKVDGNLILSSVLQNLNDALAARKSALKNLVDKAEEKFESYQKENRSTPSLEDLSFLDVKAEKSAEQMEFSPRFLQPVTFERSGVHIPLEIFDGWMGPRYKEAWWHDSEILKGLNWTASLDEVFKENRAADPNLRWQYFGSYYGFMRVYPAFRWPDHPSLPDLFDVRRRSWYIQSSVSPKDVIILIDRSGSVHGPTLDIMKITAKALLNSLGENDFVNVAWFNNKVRWVVPCINTLVQATAQTRRLLGDAVEKLTESNLTSYSTALDFAFEQFKKFDEMKKPWIGSNCHKVVMFLSDGGTEWPTDLIGRHCNESRNGRIKIFTFACGPHPIPTVVLKEMACSTGGYFSPVTALGSVRIKIRDYVKVLSRPLALSSDGELFQWHNFHRDVAGLGMVTAVTLPVFDRSSRHGKAGRLLGVMGIDVTIDEMTGLFPKHLLGAFGYPFAINTNGFVVFHPRLHDHITYLEDPPNIYLSDLEGADVFLEDMEKAIIDGINGSLKNRKSVVPVGLGHAVLTKMDYFYGAIEAATFRFGVALPSDHSVVKVKVPNPSHSILILSSIRGAFIAPWTYCSQLGGEEDVTIENLAKVIMSDYSLCDQDLVHHLLWDGQNAFEIQSHWNRSEGSFPQVHSRFLITAGGLNVQWPPPDKEDTERQADPQRSNLFKRASRSGAFVFSPGRERRDRVTVAGRITVKDSLVAAVIGAEIDQESIGRVFEEFDSGLNCTSSELLHCYLLNDGGLILTSNVKSSKPSDFIGVHDPELLEALVTEGVFKREYRNSYQSWCSRNERQVQGKASSRHSSIFQCIFNMVAAVRWDFLYAVFISFASSVSARKKAENTEEHLFDGGNHSCVTRSPWYYHGEGIFYSGAINCGTQRSHSRAFRASFSPDLMVLFLVSQPPCQESNFFAPVNSDASEDVEFHYCRNLQHYRIRPGKCHSQMPKDMTSDCGATSNSPTVQMTESILSQAILYILLLSSAFQ